MEWGAGALCPSSFWEGDSGTSALGSGTGAPWHPRVESAQGAGGRGAGTVWLQFWPRLVKAAGGPCGPAGPPAPCRFCSVVHEHGHTPRGNPVTRSPRGTSRGCRRERRTPVKLEFQKDNEEFWVLHKYVPRTARGILTLKLRSPLTGALFAKLSRVHIAQSSGAVLGTECHDQSPHALPAIPPRRHDAYV